MDDLIIIGGAVAGTAAGIYAARRSLQVRILAIDLGGELVRSGEIENWPGIVKTTGIDLSDMFQNHLKSYNIPIELDTWVQTVTKNPDGTFSVCGKQGDKDVEFTSHAVIAASGVHPRELGVPGEKELKNKGLSYCTVCDGPLFKGKNVATVGGGNSALESAIMLAGLAAHVTLITKNPEMKGETVLIEKIKKLPNVTLVTNAQTTKIAGGPLVQGVEYMQNGALQTVDVQGVFVHIGMIPNSDYATLVERTPAGEIITNSLGETSVPGFFAAGDVTNHPYRQNAIAAGAGVTAALQAANYLDRK